MEDNNNLVQQRQLYRFNTIFNLIRSQPGALSRNDIVKITRFSMTAVAGAVEQLVGEGYVFENAPIQTRVGRQPALLDVNRNRLCFLGIDCMTSAITLSAIDCMGDVFFSTQIRYEMKQADDLIQVIHTIIAQFQREQPDWWIRAANMTIGLPGIVDMRDGRWVSYYGFKNWTVIPLATQMTEQYGMPVFCMNTMDAMAFGWRRTHEEQISGTRLFVLIRRGIGIKLINGNNLISEFGVPAEIGHFHSARGTRLCRCGLRGCFEAEISETGIKRRLIELVESGRLNGFQSTLPSSNDTNWLTSFLVAIRSGDPDAQNILDEISEITGELLGACLLVFLPEKIVLATHLAVLGKSYTDTVQRAMLKHLPHGMRHLVPDIIHVEPDTQICSQGAALYGIRKRFSEPDHPV